MLFGDDETWLSEFTKKYSKERTMDKIGRGVLRRWSKLTDKTDGRYLEKYMAAELWADSVESLLTGKAIVSSSTPERLHGSDACQKVLSAFTIRILKEKKKQFERTGRSFKLPGSKSAKPPRSAS